MSLFFLSLLLKGNLSTLLQGLITTPEMKIRAETAFESLAGKISSSYPDPAWNVDRALVVTRSNVEGFPMQLGRGGNGAVYLGYYLDVGVAKKAYHKKEDFDASEVELCFELHHPNIIRLLGASPAGSSNLLQPCLYFELIDGPSLGQVFSSACRTEDEDLS